MTKHDASGPVRREQHSRKFLKAARAGARRSDPGSAFIADPNGGRAKTRDALAGEIGREYLESATSGEEVGTELRDVLLPEEQGGPFVISPAKREFARDEDPSNPTDAEPEAFPAANADASMAADLDEILGDEEESL